MSQSIHTILNESKCALFCFGGMSLSFGGILPFEFLTYLSSEYGKMYDLYFIIDTQQCWYHKGIEGITHDINTTTIYLNSIINERKYDTVIFMGVSAGGYAAILFGSLCSIHTVISFIPQTILKNPEDKTYSDLNQVINNTTKYILNGDLLVSDENDPHHISHCTRLEAHTNVTVIRHTTCNLKQLRNEGFIKTLIDDVFA